MYLIQSPSSGQDRWLRQNPAGSVLRAPPNAWDSVASSQAQTAQRVVATFTERVSQDGVQRGCELEESLTQALEFLFDLLVELLVGVGQVRVDWFVAGSKLILQIKR